jgi:hypothetical protein
MLGTDQNLGGKVQRLKDSLKQSTNKTVILDGEPLLLQNQMKGLNINDRLNQTKDPLEDLFNLNENATKSNDINFGLLVH